MINRFLPPNKLINIKPTRPPDIGIIIACHHLYSINDRIKLTMNIIPDTTVNLSKKLEPPKSLLSASAEIKAPATKQIANK